MLTWMERAARSAALDKFRGPGLILVAVCTLSANVATHGGALSPSEHSFHYDREMTKVYEGEVPLAKEALDDLKFAKFESAWEKACSAARQYEVAWDRALSEDVKLKRAIELLHRVEDLERKAYSLKSRVEDHYKELGPSAFTDFEEWSFKWLQNSTHEWLQPEEDKEFAQIYLWVCRTIGAETQAPPREWFPYADLVKELLPSGDEELDEDRAVEILTIAVGRARERELQLRGGIERDNDPPDFVYDYLRAWSEANTLHPSCDAYVRYHQPDYVVAALEKWDEAVGRCFKIWPDLDDGFRHRQSLLLQQESSLRRGRPSPTPRNGSGTIACPRSLVSRSVSNTGWRMRSRWRRCCGRWRNWTSGVN